VLGLLIWNRPYERRSGNVISIFIQVVRALSVVCILVFVEELGIAQTTKTVTGVVLIAMQSLLTGALAILIAANAIIMFCKENPHRKRRKEAEKLNRDQLTPLDARDSLLLNPSSLNHTGYDQEKRYPLAKEASNDSFLNEPTNPYSGATPLQPFTSQAGRPFTPTQSYRPYTPQGAGHAAQESTENLVQYAAPLGGSPPREPRVPDMGGGGYRGRAY